MTKTESDSAGEQTPPTVSDGVETHVATPQQLLEMISGLTQTMVADKQRMATLEERVDTAAASKVTVDEEIGKVRSLMKEIELLRAGHGQSSSAGRVEERSHRETKIAKVFGEDTSPRALKLFLSHYDLVKAQNIKRGNVLWEDPSYRAGELRMALVGEASEYVDNEHSMGSTWVNSDEEIVTRLSSRYMKAECIELNILAFEESRQTEGESLAKYMTRLQELGRNAFPKNPEGIVRQRVVWRFLAGLIDGDVRQELIKSKWMDNETDAKEYGEILKIAETALRNKVASTALGGSSRKQPRGHAASASQKNKTEDPRTKKAAPKAPSSAASGQNKKPTFVCWYCNESHSGGWRQCFKRKKEAPDWRPPGTTNSHEDEKKDFS